MSETLVAPAVPEARPARAPGRLFLPYLDGMRGFFGVYIGLAHLWHRLTIVLPDFYRLPAHVIALGNDAVGVFIVMSGYVIGLPVAASGQTFRGGLGLFAKRRAFRILPAYYAALVVALPIAWFFTPRFQGSLTTHQMMVSAVLHLFMLQNLSNGLLYTIDGPMWSVAMEWDIYFLFPLVMVPMARRFGFIPMVVTSFAIGYLPLMIGTLRHEGANYPLASTSPWYIGMFALGYAAANFSIDRNPASLRRLERWHWGPLAVCFAFAVEFFRNAWFADTLLSFTIASQVTADAQARLAGGMTWVERFFSFPPLVILGTFSYSFYLLHLPIIDLVMSAARPDWTRPQVYALAAAALTLALSVAYVFYRLIERPCMTAYRRRGDDASRHSAKAQEIPDTALAAATSQTP